jgi:methylenetetrahydrofolate dehydrogenase (NADP+)/methenyltetrahydrofolate cyclohydrolase
MALINCESIAKKILKNVNGGSLAVIRNYDDPSAISYVRQLVKLASRANIEIIEEDYGSHWIKESLSRLIKEYNESEDVDGIMVVSPQPEHYECLEEIIPSKRVEGTDFDDNPERVSCTARACFHIAEAFTGSAPMLENLENMNALIIGYGKAVGKPLSYLLMRRHLISVTTTHAYTPIKDILEGHIPRADVIFTAVGMKHFIKGEYSDKLFVDAGISVDQGRVWGDLDPTLAEKNDITPVPGGVGPVTTALLLQNVSLAAQGKF